MPTANLSLALRRHVIRRAGSEALVDGVDRWTYRELDDDVDRHARALISIGVGDGDLVGILARNHATYVIELLALSRIGAVAVPINWRLHPTELGYIVEHAGLTTMLVDTDFHDNAVAVAGKGELRTLVSHGPAAPAGWLVLADLLAAAEGGAAVPDAEKDPADLQRILYTSGTTSHPKGVMLTHANVQMNHVGQILELELTPADRAMVSAPLFHVSGLEVPGLAMVYIGGTMVMTRSYKGADIVRLAAAERTTTLVLAAQIVHDILRMPDRDEHDLSALRCIVFGGVPPLVRTAVQDALPHVRLVDTFGMTEICNGACYMDAAHSHSKLGSQGAPFPHLDLRIVDAQDRPLPPGEVGEIVVRGPKVSPGYWRDPEATARAWRGGWFHSGDMASLDADGFLWFSDRRADMIKTGGENVASAEIERAIAEHPAVAEVAVVAVPDERWDEVAKAFVVVVPGATLTVAEVNAHCEAHLGRFKIPKHVEIVADLPRNDSGKVLKRLLRDPEGAASAAAMRV